LVICCAFKPHKDFRPFFWAWVQPEPPDGDGVGVGVGAGDEPG